MTAQFGGQVVVVTGGAGGIGLATCRAFASRGADLAILDLDEDAARTAADALSATGVRTWAGRCDISDETAVEDGFAAIERALGTPDVLVNNAGINPRTDPLELTLETWNRVLATNLTGYFLCSRAAGRRMVARGRGAIVNVTSIAASTALGRGNFAFAVAKAGVEAATRELAVEWARRGVRVNTVAPCQVATQAFTESMDALVEACDPRARDYLRGIPVGRAATPDEVAATIVFLASAEASMVTGVSLAVDGGNLALNAGGSIG